MIFTEVYFSHIFVSFLLGILFCNNKKFVYEFSDEIWMELLAAFPLDIIQKILVQRNNCVKSNSRILVGNEVCVTKNLTEFVNEMILSLISKIWMFCNSEDVLTNLNF